MTPSDRLSAATLAVVAIIVGLATAAGAAPAAASCQNLRIGPTLRSALTQAHPQKKEGPIAKGSVYYGRCGSTRYALATFSNALADQPERFRRRAGHRWFDLGDTGDPFDCSSSNDYRIPHSLLRLWHVCSAG